MALKRLFFVTLFTLMVLSCSKDDEPKNNAPTITDKTFTVKENIAAGDPIGTLTASDKDGDALTFGIAENDNGLFAITAKGALSLATGKSLDFETAAEHTISVSVNDGEATAEATITINVEEVPNNAPEVAESELAIDVLENISDTAVIVEIEATDEDGDELSFSITDGNGAGLFEIIKVEGKGHLSLVTGKSLDFETQQSHTITIGVGDGKDTTLVTISITVIEVNENSNNPPVAQDQAFEVAENQTEIGTVAAEDAEGDDISFQIIENDSELFQITQTGGVLSLADGKSLDYETNQTHTIKVYVSDNWATTTITITINVTNINEAPEIESTTYEFDVAEDIADTEIIGTKIAATDPEGDALEYNITAGDDNGLFEVNADGELNLVQGKNLDYETATSYILTISVSDGELSAAENIIVTLSITNVIEPGELSQSPDSFITKWETTEPYEEVIIGTYNSNSYSFNYIIDWGDGNVEELTTGNPTHIYEVANTYTVAIQGEFPSFGTAIGYPGTSQCESMEQWGNIEWRSLRSAFQNYAYMQYNATDKPNLSNQGADLSLMFATIISFTNGDITGWDVSNATNMRYMFSQSKLFNQDISNWNVSNVINMEFMFWKANSFNQNIDNWDVSNVTNIRRMFEDATSFNQDIGHWDISNVSDMSYMLNNSGLSQNNYGATIVGWATQEPGEGPIPTNITLGASGLEYCSNDSEVLVARNNLLGAPYNWDIQGDTGVICTEP